MLLKSSHLRHQPTTCGHIQLAALPLRSLHTFAGSPRPGIYDLYSTVYSLTYKVSFIHSCSLNWTVTQKTGVIGRDGEFHSTELCRSFAGIEQSLAIIQGSLCPCFSAMISAGLTCPPSLREWV